MDKKLYFFIWKHYQCLKVKWSGAVFRLRIRSRISMFLGLPDPHPLITRTDPDADPDPSQYWADWNNSCKIKYKYKIFLDKNWIFIIKHILCNIDASKYHLLKHEKNRFFCILKATENFVTDPHPHPDPYQNVTDPEHWSMYGTGFGTADQFRPLPDELRGLGSGLSEPLERGRGDVTRRCAARLRGQLIHLLVQVPQPAAGQHRHGRLDPVCCMYRSGSETGTSSFKIQFVYEFLCKSSAGDPDPKTDPDPHVFF